MGVKRGVDIVLGTVLAILALPAILAAAAISAITLRAWPLFVQERVGKGGRPFRLPKVRTLPPDTATATDKYALQGVEIPAFSRFLRRTHLDELPQLLLVPFGVMSLVGPRPEMPSVLAHYPADFAIERASVRPGCTCLWQLSRSAHKLIYEAPEFDRAYLRHRGPLLDAWILYRTARAWFPKASAIGLGDLPTWACRTRFDGERVTRPGALPDTPALPESPTFPNTRPLFDDPTAVKTPAYD